MLTVDGHVLTETLQRGYTFAEEGVSEVLEALGIVADDSTVEFRDLDPTIDANGKPFGERARREPEPVGPTMAGVLAAAIDHTSAGWHRLVAEN